MYSLKLGIVIFDEQAKRKEDALSSNIFKFKTIHFRLKAAYLTFTLVIGMSLAKFAVLGGILFATFYSQHF